MSDAQNPVTREELAQVLYKATDPQYGWHLMNDWGRRPYRTGADAILAKFTVLHPAPVAVPPSDDLFEDAGSLWEPPYLGCMVPPTGWWCSREPGHDGPCAARPGTPPSEQVTLDPEPWNGEFGRKSSKCSCGCNYFAPRRSLGYSTDPADYSPKDTK